MLSDRTLGKLMLNDGAMKQLVLDLPPGDFINLIVACRQLSAFGQPFRGVGLFACTRPHLGCDHLTLGKWLRVWEGCSSYAHSQGWEATVWVHVCLQVYLILERLSLAMYEDTNEDECCFLSDYTEIQVKCIIPFLNIVWGTAQRTGRILDLDFVDEHAINDEHVAYVIQMQGGFTACADNILSHGYVMDADVEIGGLVILSSGRFALVNILDDCEFVSRKLECVLIASSSLCQISAKVAELWGRPMCTWESNHRLCLNLPRDIDTPALDLPVVTIDERDHGNVICRLVGQQLSNYFQNDPRSFKVKTARDGTSYPFKEFLEWYNESAIIHWLHAKEPAGNTEAILSSLLQLPDQLHTPSSANTPCAPIMPFQYAFVVGMHYHWLAQCGVFVRNYE